MFSWVPRSVTYLDLDFNSFGEITFEELKIIFAGMPKSLTHLRFNLNKDDANQQYCLPMLKLQ